jgi:hypothetical protein
MALVAGQVPISGYQIPDYSRVGQIAAEGAMAPSTGSHWTHRAVQVIPKGTEGSKETGFCCEDVCQGVEGVHARDVTNPR